jgi:hypothetical protein
MPIRQAESKAHRGSTNQEWPRSLACGTREGKYGTARKINNRMKFWPGGTARDEVFLLVLR